MQIPQADGTADSCSISRRHFFGAAAGMAGAAGLLQTRGAQAVPPTVRRVSAESLIPPEDRLPAPVRSRLSKPGVPSLRTISYNVLQCDGWPKSNSRAKRFRISDDRAQRYAESIAKYDPDIVTFCEAPDEPLCQEIARLMGMECLFFTTRQSWPGALMTKLEILEWRDCPVPGGRIPPGFFTRHWGRVVVREKNGDPLVVHSLHLHAFDSPMRKAEMEVVIEAMRRDLQAQVPMVIQGDFNHTPLMEEYRRWQQAGLVDSFSKVGHGLGLTMPTGLPVLRLDYVLCSGPMVARMKESHPLSGAPFTIPALDPMAFALSDHLPQMATFA